MEDELNYDNQGRIAYTEGFHNKTGKPWDDDDLDYLINWYDKISGIEMSLALERPETTIRSKVCRLRKKGVM